MTMRPIDSYDFDHKVGDEMSPTGLYCPNCGAKMGAEMHA